MALSQTPYSVNLDTNNPNMPLYNHIMQGSNDAKFIITVLKDGVEQTIDANAKITMIINYGVSSSCGTAVTKGSYVLAPDDTDYGITIALGKIEIPITEMMTTASGVNQMILKIDDTSIAYTYSMLYTVDINPAYTAQSTPDNLPTYNQLKTEMAAVKVEANTNKGNISTNTGKINSNTQKIATNTQDIANMKAKDSGHDGDITKVKQDITNLKAKDTSTDGEISTIKATAQQQAADITKAKQDITTNANVVATKANLNLDNVGEFATAADGDLFYKKDNKLKIAPIKVNDALKQVISKYSWTIPPNSLHFGMNTSMHENGGFLEYRTESLNKDYLLLDYENDPLTGTLKPIYYQRGVKEIQVPIQPIDNVSVNNVTLVNLGRPAFNRQVQKIYFKLINPVTNLKIKLNVNGKDVADYPTGAWSDDTIAGYNVGNNLQSVDLLPFWSSLTNYDIKIYLKADSAINMFGNGVLPYIAEDLNRITLKEMATMEDVAAASGKDTAQEIKDKLLTVKYPYAGLENTPTIPSIETGATIKGKLESLTNDDRLSATAIKDLPSTTAPSFLSLTDTPPSYLGNADKFIKVNAAHTGLEFVEGTGTGATTFVGLTDTPDSIVANKMVVGSVDGSKLEFKDIPAGAGGATTFLELTDTPSVYEDNKLLASSKSRGITFIDPPNFALPDLSNITNANFKTKSVAAGMLQQDLADVDITKLDEKIQTTDTIKQNDRDILAINGELKRIKTDISDAGKVYSYRGKTAPILPTTEGYKSYYINVYALRDNVQTIILPLAALNLQDGTIMCINNDDKTNPFYVNPGLGQTIDSKAGTHKMSADSIFFMVKKGNDWATAFEGLMVRNLDTIMQAVATKFNSQLHTLAEIESQLKDRLHTFREIQTEFSDQLHTFPSINAEMVKEGFSKGFSLGYGRLDTNVVPNDSAWVQVFIEPNAEVIIPPTDQGQKYLGLYMPVYLAALVSSVNINNAEEEYTEREIVVDDLHYQSLLVNNPIDTSTSNRLKIQFRDSSETLTGITVEDGTNSYGGIRTIQTQSLDVLKTGDTGVFLDAYTKWIPLEDKGNPVKADNILIEFPLEVKLAQGAQTGKSIAQLNVKPGYFELSKAPGFLAYLNKEEAVRGRQHPSEAGTRVGTVWFDDIVVGGGVDIQVDRENKAIGLQDYTDDDPSVTGGVPYLIILRIAIRGKVENDGWVRLSLKSVKKIGAGQDGETIIDADKNAIAMQHQYKAGQTFGYITAAGIYMAKELIEMQVVVEHNFAEDEIMLEDRTEGISGIMVQALTPTSKTGLALLQYENDTMQNIEFTYQSSRGLLYSLSYSLSSAMPKQTFEIGQGQTTIDGAHLYNSTRAAAIIENNTIEITDDGVNPCYFNIGEIFSFEKTKLLRGRGANVGITFANELNDFTLYGVKWTGEPDKFTTKIFSDSTAGVPTVEPGWEIVAKANLVKDASSGMHDFDTFTNVPDDANNFAFIIAPNTKERPMKLNITKFQIFAKEPYDAWILNVPEMIDEKHLVQSEEYKKISALVSDTTDTALNYELTNTPITGIPLPVGIVRSGAAAIEIDRTVNVDPNSVYKVIEGVIKFDAEGKATISTKMPIASGIAHSILTTTKFWYSKVSTDGNTFTKIDESEYTVDVRGQTYAVNTMPDFTFVAKKGDRLALFGTTSVADGCQLYTKRNNIPLVEISIAFDVITEDEMAIRGDYKSLKQEVEQLKIQVAELKGQKQPMSKMTKDKDFNDWR